MQNTSNLNYLNGNQAKSDYSYPSMQANSLIELFQAEINEFLLKEKSITKDIPKMIKNAKTADLIVALTSHLELTQLKLKNLLNEFIHA